MSNVTVDDGQIIRQLDEINRKLDLIIAHLGLTGPTGLPHPSYSDTARYAVPPHAVAVPYPDVLRYLQDGKMIRAVKAYRDATGAGLAEAKQAVEAIARQHGLR